MVFDSNCDPAGANDGEGSEKGYSTLCTCVNNKPFKSLLLLKSLTKANIKRCSYDNQSLTPWTENRIFDTRNYVARKT
jgi:hypothetical protein